MSLRAALLATSLLLHTASMAPWGFTSLAWICLVPLFAAVVDLVPARAFLTGLLWGTAQIWLVCSWTAPALAFYWQQPWWFGTAFLLVAAAIFVGIYYALFAWAVTRIRHYGGVTFAVLAAALWVTVELGQSVLLGGDPWMLLGYALAPRPLLAQLADVGGVFLLSFVVVMVNALLFESWRRRSIPASALRSLLCAGAVVALAAAYGAVRLNSSWPAGEARSVVVVQANNDPGSQWQSASHGRSLEAYLRLTREALSSSTPQLVVWPESAVTFFVSLEPYYRDQIARLVREGQVELILGGPHADTAQAERPRYFNSAFHFDRQGEITGRYDKVHLLPFAEYFPLQTISLLRRRFERVRTFSAGDEPQLLPSPFGPAAVAICFEGIFPSLVRSYMGRGAGLLINLSNDSWLGAGAGPEQHLTMVALRAVEHRTWVIRATTTGVSAIIDPYGRLVARSRINEEAVVRHDVSEMHVDTIYESIGDGFAAACVVITVLAIVVAPGRRRSKLFSSLLRAGTIIESLGALSVTKTR